MGIIQNYEGRKFIESEYYPLISRHIAGLSKNRIWIYTVDKCNEIDRDSGEITDKIIIRIVRWRARNDEKNKHIKYWRKRSAYNVRSIDEWTTTSQIVDTLIDEKMDDSNFIILPQKEYESLRRDTTESPDLIQKIRRLKTEKAASKAQLDLFKKRFKLMKQNVKDYEKILSNFKALIERGDSTETEAHKFLEEQDAFWLFGLEYIEVKSKVNFPPGKKDYQFDMMLKRNDGFWDLSELKGPNERLFDKRTMKRNKPNQKLSEAIGQVFTYMYACDSKKLKNIFKPKAIIVMGKGKTDDARERRLFSSYLTNVELITYTELYQRGKKLLDYIKSSAHI